MSFPAVEGFPLSSTDGTIRSEKPEANLLPLADGTLLSSFKFSHSKPPFLLMPKLSRASDSASCVDRLDCKLFAMSSYRNRPVRNNRTDTPIATYHET